jgi:hypothetical protein
MILRTGWCFLLGLLSLVTSGCAGPGVSGDDYTLVASPPRLEHVSPQVSKEEIDRALVERHRWRSGPESWPAADLVFVRVKEIYGGRLSFIRRETLPDHIHSAFSAGQVTLGTNGTTKNVLGNLSVRIHRHHRRASRRHVRAGVVLPSGFAAGSVHPVPAIHQQHRYPGLRGSLTRLRLHEGKARTPR